MGPRRGVSTVWALQSPVQRIPPGRRPKAGRRSCPVRTLARFRLRFIRVGALFCRVAVVRRWCLHPIQTASYSCVGAADLRRLPFRRASAWFCVHEAPSPRNPSPSPCQWRCGKLGRPVSAQQYRGGGRAALFGQPFAGSAELQAGAVHHHGAGRFRPSEVGAPPASKAGGWMLP